MPTRPDFPPQTPADTGPSRPSGHELARDDAAPSVDRVRSIVSEIRNRLAEVRAREVTLDQRAVELEERAAAIRAAQRMPAQVTEEFTKAQHAADVRIAEINAQAVELNARRARLAQLQQTLAQREATQAKEREQLERDRTEVREQREAIDAQIARDRQILQNRIGIIRQREQELERRLRLARDEIVGERAQIESRKSELDSELESATRSRDELAERVQEIERRAATLNEQSHEIDLLRRRIASDRERFEQDRAQFQRRLREIEQREAALARRITEIQERSTAIDRQRDESAHAEELRRAEIERENAELAQSRSALKQLESDLVARRSALDDRENQLKGQAAALKADRLAIKDAESQIQHARAELETARQRVTSIEQAAEEHRRQAAELREQMETRDAESRQAALSLEVERRDLARERDTLAQQIENLDKLRETRESEFVETRVQLARESQRLRKAEQSIAALPSSWWTRCGIIATAAAIFAAFAWLQWERPAFEAAVTIRIINAASSLPTAIADHRVRLLDPNLLDGADGTGRNARDWSQAVRDGRVRTLAAGGDSLRLALENEDDLAASRLLKSAAELYAARANAVTPGENIPQEYREIVSWRDNLAFELTDFEAQRTGHKSVLDSLSDPAVHERTIDDISKIRAEHARIVRTLTEERARLTSLAAREAAPGTVDEDAPDKALSVDDLYQEDLKEYRASALTYRTELGVAMLQVIDPAKSLTAALRKLAAVVEEQRQLTPPENVASMLEQTAADIETQSRKLSTFLETWQNDVDAVQKINTEREVSELVRKQNAAALAARAMSDGLMQIVIATNQRLESLNAESTGSTREQVIKALLTSEVGAFATSASKLAEVAAGIDTSTNFRLETADRQLRGLTTRVNQRRETIRQQLQLDADRESRQAHLARIEQSRERARELEQQRDELVASLIDRGDELRLLDQEAARRAKTSLQLEAVEGRITWLRNKIDQLDQKLTLLRRSGPAPDRLEIGPVTVASRTPARHQHAALFGVGTFLFTAFVGFVLVAKNPWRQRPADVERLLGAPISRT